MPKIQIAHSDSCQPTQEWEEVVDFKSRGRIVDATGHALSADYRGVHYTILSKWRRRCTPSERVERTIQSIFSILTLDYKIALGFWNDEWVRLRIAVPTQRPIFAGPLDNQLVFFQRKLEERIDISLPISAAVHACLGKIMRRTALQGVRCFSCAEHHRVFSVDSIPGLVFKVTNYTSREQPFLVTNADRFASTVEAYRTIKTSHFDLLKIPHMRLFTLDFDGRTYSIIAEQKMDIEDDASIQEELYLQRSHSIDMAIMQVVRFICATGFERSSWKDLPILENSLDQEGNRKIVLIDIEDIGSINIESALINLIECVSYNQLQSIRNTTRGLGIHTRQLDIAMAVRTAELKKNEMLRQFYREKQIVVGTEHVIVDRNLLFFTNDQVANEKLVQLTLLIVDEINLQVSRSSPESSVKKRREIYLNTHNGNFLHSTGTIFGIPLHFLDAEVRQAIQKLIDIRVIFSLLGNNKYFLQA